MSWKKKNTQKEKFCFSASTRKFQRWNVDSTPPNKKPEMGSFSWTFLRFCVILMSAPFNHFVIRKDSFHIILPIITFYYWFFPIFYFWSHPKEPDSEKTGRCVQCSYLACVFCSLFNFHSNQGSHCT